MFIIIIIVIIIIIIISNFVNFKLTNHTKEITSLGFISDSSPFTKQINIEPLP